MKQTLSTPIPGIRRVPVWVALVALAGVGYWWMKRKETNASAGQ